MGDTRLVDPLGNEVWLLEEVWQHHIVGNHIRWGPRLSEWRQAVEDAVTTPMVILASDQELHPSGTEYYGQAQIGSQTVLVKVCVESAGQTGRPTRQVKTAMAVRKVGRGAQRWP